MMALSMHNEEVSRVGSPRGLQAVQGFAVPLTAGNTSLRPLSHNQLSVGMPPLCSG